MGRPSDAAPEPPVDDAQREESRPRDDDSAAGASQPGRDGGGDDAPDEGAKPHGDPLVEEVDEAGEGVDADGEPAGEEPADPLAVAERERDEYLAVAQRTQADFENFRKRAARDVAAASGRAKAAIARELLPAVDNLERALAAAGEGDEGLLHGVKLVHTELVAALERNGVQSFEPAGEPFDPTVHEAISTRPEDGAEAGVVLDVVEKGYRLDGTILRPARVVVAA